MIEPEAAHIDVAGRQAALKAKGLMGDDSVAKSYSDQLGEQLKASIALVDPNFGAGNTPEITHSKPTRRPRKDKGTHRVKPTAQQPGKISAEQYERLNDLIITAEDRRKEYEVAADNEAKALAHLEAAIRERNDFIDELAGKGK